MLSLLCWICAASFAIGNGTTAQPKGQVTYTLTDPSSFQPNYPLRSVAQGWTGLTNLPACAYKTFHESGSSIGFLYSTSQRLCTPLTGFVVPGTGGSRQLEESEGHLYLFKKDCPLGFQLFRVDDIYTCLRISTTVTNYKEATTTCQSWGGHLAATKTSAKVELIVALVGGAASFTFAWVGLDDLELEDQFIWQLDGTKMTDTERQTVFSVGEPSNSYDAEHCVNVNKNAIVNDAPCTAMAGFICEYPHQ